MGNTVSQQPTNTGLPPKVGDIVNTQFGPGKVESYREDDNVFVVALRWQLAEKSKAYAYLQADALTKRKSAEDTSSELYAPGTFVETPQGVAVVQSYRIKDGFYVVEYINWLTDGQTAKGFLQPANVKHVQRARKGQYVSTPYGTGVMAGVRKDGVHVVKIKQFEGGATAYLQADAINGVLKAYVSSIVQTPFGQGTVTAYRPEDDMYGVQLDFAVCFLGPESVDFVSGPRSGAFQEPVTPSSPAAGSAGRLERQASCVVS